MRGLVKIVSVFFLFSEGQKFRADNFCQAVKGCTSAIAAKLAP